MPKFYIGVDLGQKRDYTALAIAEKTLQPSGYAVRHLERIQLNIPYPAMADHVVRQLRSTMVCGTTALVVDSSGVGLPVLDLLRARGARPVAVTITGGKSVHQADGIFRVPKRDLVIGLVKLFDLGRLKIAAEIPHASELISELLEFRVRISQRTRRESYEAGKRSCHDDLVIAVALACWYAERED